MKILAVDDEKLMLERLCDCITQAAPSAELISFQKASNALEYVQTESIDVAFLDIKMRGMSGLDFRKQIKKLQPEVNVIFCTGYDNYVLEAVNQVRCNGYVLKPVTVEDIKVELNNLRAPLVEKNEKRKHQLYLSCFGNFEAFIDGKPIEFGVQKTKELLAYLTDRNGAMIKMQRLKPCYGRMTENSIVIARRYTISVTKMAQV